MATNPRFAYKGDRLKPLRAFCQTGRLGSVSRAGEALFLDEAGTLYPFEVRTRTRTVDGWTNDVYRPFPKATDLADAIEARRGEKPEWESSSALTAVSSNIEAYFL